MNAFLKKVGAAITTRSGSIWTLVKTSITKWWAMDPFRQSAIIAYYAVFSLPALLVIVVSIAGFAFGADAVNGKIIEQIKGTMGADTAEQIKVMLAKASETKTSIWATILGIITVILGSIGVFVELQKTLNIIWEVEEKPKKGVWGFLRARVFSFGLILSIAFMLMISLVVSTGLAAASDLLHSDSSKFLAFLFESINFLVSIGVITVLFALMFKYLPDTQITWRQVWPGAIVTAVLFTIGKTGLAFYFGKADPGSGYGAAGSIVLILLWVSYSSMILFLGAEFTHTYADMQPGAKEKKQQEQEKRTKEKESEQKKPTDSKRNALLKIAPFVLPLLSIVNMILPFLLPVILKRLTKGKDMMVEWKRLSISLIRPQIKITGLAFKHADGKGVGQQVSGGVEDMTLVYRRGAFFQGQFEIQSLMIQMPTIDVTLGKGNASSKSSGKEEDIPILPVVLRRMTIDKGKAQFKNLQTSPTTSVFADNINITLTSMGEDVIQSAVLFMDFRAMLLGGSLYSSVVLEPNISLPSFTMKLELADINLVALNDFFQAYAKIDVHRGSLDVFAETVTDRGLLKGYIKPLITNLEILGPEDLSKALGAQIKEGLVGLVKEGLENQRHQQVATEIPLEGYFKSPHVFMGHALLAAGINIFVQALKPEFSKHFKWETAKIGDWFPMFELRSNG